MLVWAQKVVGVYTRKAAKQGDSPVVTRECVQASRATSKYMEDNDRFLTVGEGNYRHGKGKKLQCVLCGLDWNDRDWCECRDIETHMFVCVYIHMQKRVYTCVYSLALSTKRASSNEPPGVQTLVSKYNSSPKGLLVEMAASRPGAWTVQDGPATSSCARK